MIRAPRQNSHYAWYKKWGKTTARPGALLDRLTHHVHILEINGESYRLKRGRENAGSLRSGEPDDV